MFGSFQENAMKFMQSEMGRRLMANPNFQSFLMKTINTRAEVRKKVTVRVQEFAKNYKLVTRDDFAGLRRNIRDLEATVQALKAELAEANARAEAATAKVAKSSARRPKRSTKK